MLATLLGPASAAERVDPRRLRAFQALIRDLTTRGVDAKTLLRLGMGDIVAASLIRWLILEPIFSSETPQSVGGFDQSGWCQSLRLRSLEEFGDSTDEVVRDAVIQEIGRVRPLLEAWVEDAPFDHLLTLEAPSSEQLEAALVARRTNGFVREQYKWLVDRLTVEQLESWMTTSLHNEYRWIEDSIVPPCSQQLMDQRSLNPTDLNREIARRAVRSAKSDEAEGRRSLLSQLHSHAKFYLKQNRCREAAALFEFYLRERRDDSAALNNYAFCLIPVDPGQALHQLEKASRAYRPRTINVYNQVSCLYLLSRAGDALDRAEYHWNRELEEAPVTGLLWKVSEGLGHELVEVIDARLQLAEFAIDIAKACQRWDRVGAWEDRTKQLQAAN